MDSLQHTIIADVAHDCYHYLLLLQLLLLLLLLLLLPPTNALDAVCVPMVFIVDTYYLIHYHQHRHLRGGRRRIIIHDGTQPYSVSIHDEREEKGD